MKTIEVKSCGECPFNYYYRGRDYCNLNKEIKDFWLPTEKVHENCPLKTESITVKLKSDE